MGDVLSFSSRFVMLMLYSDYICRLYNDRSLIVCRVDASSRRLICAFRRVIIVSALLDLTSSRFDRIIVYRFDWIVTLQRYF